MTLEEFKKDIMEGIKELPDNWREGQKVFNYTNFTYHVARKVQLEYGIDCFYNDKEIDNFIEKAYICLNENIS